MPVNCPVAPELYESVAIERLEGILEPSNFRLTPCLAMFVVASLLCNHLPINGGQQ